MPRDPRQLLFIGIQNSVIALDTRDGSEVWRLKLGGSSVVVVHWDGRELFATAKGEAFRLDPQTGAVVWNNKLKGLGHGSATIASTRGPSQSTSAVVAEMQRQAGANAAAGAAV